MVLALCLPIPLTFINSLWLVLERSIAGMLPKCVNRFFAVLTVIPGKEESACIARSAMGKADCGVYEKVSGIHARLGKGKRFFVAEGNLSDSLSPAIGLSN